MNFAVRTDPIQSELYCSTVMIRHGIVEACSAVLVLCTVFCRASFLELPASSMRAVVMWRHRDVIRLMTSSWHRFVTSLWPRFVTSWVVDEGLCVHLLLSSEMRGGALFTAIMAVAHISCGHLTDACNLWPVGDENSTRDQILWLR